MLTSGPVCCLQLWGEYICSGYRAQTKCTPVSPTPSPTPSPKHPPPPSELRVLSPAPPPPACAAGSSFSGADTRSCTYALTNAQIPATGATLLVAIVISGNDYPGLAFTSPITPSRHAAFALILSALQPMYVAAPA